MIGNQFVRYTVVRTLSGVVGHSAGSVVSVDLALRVKNRKRVVDRSVQESLANKAVITRHKGVTEWACTTPPVTGDDAALMREFLDSVEGLFFQWDPDNPSATSPNNLRGVMLTRAGYTEKRSQSGADQSADYFTFTWMMREVS